MIPRRVELTNFLSFGERQSIEFTDDEPLWVLCGANGVGKSAVFDAMTFALFGTHRGGSQNAGQLIRHRATSFLVAFEFEFSTARYEVVRGRDRRAPVQRVRRLVGDRWEELDLSPHPGRDPIRVWAEHTIGLDYDAFTASVMLRQGEADRIITAAPRDRLDFLRKVVGAERYERLHDRVHAAARNLRARYEAVTDERSRVPEVSAAQLEEAATALRAATAAVDAARSARDGAAVRVEQARNWNRLDTERAEIERLLGEADARAAEREVVERDHARLVELSSALPTACELVGLRDRLKQHDADIARLAGEFGEATAARDRAAAEVAATRQHASDARQCAEIDRRSAQQLREQIARTERLVGRVEEASQLDAQLRGYPEELDRQHAEALTEVQRLASDRQLAGERRATATKLLQLAAERRRDFDAIEVGAKCSRCGQPVSAEHAQRERNELDSAIALHEAERDAADRSHREAEAALEGGTEALRQLAGLVRERDRVRDRLDVHRTNLAAEGVVADAPALRAEIAASAREADTLERLVVEAARGQHDAEDAARQHDAERQEHDSHARALQCRLIEAKTSHDQGRGRQQVLLDQLPVPWANRLPTLTPADLDRDQFDLDRLWSADVELRYQRLGEDAARREGWELRLGRVRDEIGRVPDAARCAVPEAERTAAAAAGGLREAESAHNAARDLDNQRRRDSDRHAELNLRVGNFERDHRLHAELARLLGPDGLQRELVRTAERDIVRYAAETVRSISRGDLTIELDDGEVGPDKALSLRVRRADDPTPTGVNFLSGSEKFRVAVAVALAIGRFASGQARPLESVIIDEGFGSLDRDGLQAMGDELRNLQQSQSLRRVILVSHQEEFVARFPVGYRLEPGENGTTATPFRRECGEN